MLAARNIRVPPDTRLTTGGGDAVQVSAGGDISLSGGDRVTPAPLGVEGGRISLSTGRGIQVLASPVPEPSAALLMSFGLLALIGLGRRSDSSPRRA